MQKWQIKRLNFNYTNISVSTLVLTAGFRAGLAGLNLDYPKKNPLLNLKNPAKLGSLIFFYVGLSWA